MRKYKLKAYFVMDNIDFYRVGYFKAENASKAKYMAFKIDRDAETNITESNYSVFRCQELDNYNFNVIDTWSITKEYLKELQKRCLVIDNKDAGYIYFQSKRKKEEAENE